MELRTKSTGYRQAAWDALRLQPWENVAELAKAIGASPDGLRSYVRALIGASLVSRDALGTIRLVRDTGPRAPSFSLSTGELHDWNTHPRISPEQAKAIIAASGLSLTQWLESNGFSPNGQTRLRQMLNGQRPMSATYDEALRKP